MSYQIQQDQTSLPLRFLLVLSSDHITGATGKTPTVTIAKNDGLGFVTPAGAVSELGSGWYSVAPNATDASVLGPLTLHATATACDPADEEFLVVNYNPASTAVQASASTATTSVRDLLTAAFQRIKVLQEGEVPGPQMIADGLLRLNDLIDLDGAQPLTIFQVVRSTMPLLSDTGTLADPYLIGPGGDLDIAWPSCLDHMTYTLDSDTTVTEYPLPLLTYQAWALMSQKDRTAIVPSWAYYEPTYPQGSLYVTPQASSDGDLVVYIATTVPKFGALTDLVALPHGYSRWYRDRVAIDLWPEYRDGDPPATLMRSVRDAEALIKAKNVRMTDLVVDTSFLHPRAGYSIYLDR